MDSSAEALKTEYPSVETKSNTSYFLFTRIQLDPESYSCLKLVNTGLSAKNSFLWAKGFSLNKKTT